MRIAPNIAVILVGQNDVKIDDFLGPTLSYIYIYKVVGSNPTQAQCNFSSEELHWVSHGVVGGKCQYFTLSSFKYH